MAFIGLSRALRVSTGKVNLSSPFPAAFVFRWFFHRSGVCPSPWGSSMYSVFVSLGGRAFSLFFSQRGGAVEARLAHDQEAGGSISSPATILFLAALGLCAFYKPPFSTSLSSTRISPGRSFLYGSF
jgi:hypothetical protein